MKKFIAELTSKVIIGVVSAATAGFIYEQARKAGKKSDWLVNQIEQWDQKVHG